MTTFVARATDSVAGGMTGSLNGVPNNCNKRQNNTVTIIFPYTQTQKFGTCWSNNKYSIHYTQTEKFGTCWSNNKYSIHYTQTQNFGTCWSNNKYSIEHVYTMSTVTKFIG